MLFPFTSWGFSAILSEVGLAGLCDQKRTKEEGLSYRIAKPAKTEQVFAIYWKGTITTNGVVAFYKPAAHHTVTG
jgi:hypothetical protein